MTVSDIILLVFSLLNLMLWLHASLEAQRTREYVAALWHELTLNKPNGPLPFVRRPTINGEIHKVDPSEHQEYFPLLETVHGPFTDRPLRKRS